MKALAWPVVQVAVALHWWALTAPTESNVRSLFGAMACGNSFASIASIASRCPSPDRARSTTTGHGRADTRCGWHSDILTREQGRQSVE